MNSSEVARSWQEEELSKTTEQDTDQSREDQYYIMESSVEAACSPWDHPPTFLPLRDVQTQRIEHSTSSEAAR